MITWEYFENLCFYPLKSHRLLHVMNYLHIWQPTHLYLFETNNADLITCLKDKMKQSMA